MKDLCDMFPEQDPTVLSDLFEQLFSRKDLVIEYILNGKVSPRVLQQLQKQDDQDRRRRERSAFEEEEEG